MVAPPPISRETVQSLYQKGIEAAIIKSGGKFTDISPGSPISAIEEGLAVIGGGIIDRVNQLAGEIEQNRLVLFGISKQLGQTAVGTVEVRLDGLYVEAFQLPLGFEIDIQGVTFETISPLTIPRYTQSGTVAISAQSPGSVGNISQGSAVSFQPIPKVASILLTESTLGGVDTESDDEYKNRLYQLLRRRDTLISEDDFEQEVIDILGNGAAALAVGRLKPDLNSYSPGYVGVFALNPDGSQLNLAQLAQIQETLERKAAMATITVGSMETFDLHVNVYSQVDGNAQSIADQINDVVRIYLKPGNLQPGNQVLNKALEFQLQNITGVIQGMTTVLLNGLEQPQSLPRPWSIALVKSVEVKLNDTAGDEFSFSY